MGMLRRVAGRVAAGVVRRLQRGPEPPVTRSAPPPEAGPAAGSPELGGAVIPAESLQTIGCDPQELRERLDAGEAVVIVDLRTTRAGGLPGARHIPLESLPARWQELADADEIVLVDEDGTTSEQAARMLRDRGLINATSLVGGLAAWRESGGPTVD
ncbi:MAG: rhodanese-like domain-containing protein [Deltaproteobacteria bacterium]|nr:MAG: rhodanese-like domain-containing protein [Deltaproteobacteria bacterium]